MKVIKVSLKASNVNRQIEDIVSQCATCAQFRKAQPAEPMISHEIPDRPWSKIATDLYHLNGPQYLILVDYYSKFPEIILLNSTKAGPVIAAMKSIFARQGIPDSVMSDNGPPFDSATFASFARNWEFEHTTSSPGFPQSNRQVEHCIQTVRKHFLLFLSTETPLLMVQMVNPLQRCLVVGY